MTDTAPEPVPAPRLDVVSHLRSSTVFGNLDRGILEQLAECLREMTVHAGDALMVEGDSGGDAYIVINGRLVAQGKAPRLNSAGARISIIGTSARNRAL